jgi:hypothetical protein
MWPRNADCATRLLQAVQYTDVMFRTRRLILVSVGGAVTALIAGIILILAVDATTASAVVASFAIILSALALIATLQVQSSDFRAEEMVTEDVARLLASLRSTLLKLTWLSQQKDRTAERFASLIDGERATIQAFLVSTTAHAFYALEARKSVAADKQPEEWRIFLLHLTEILGLAMPAEFNAIGHRAARAEPLVAGLSRADIATLSADVADLPRAIASFEKYRERSVLAAVAVEVFGRTVPDDTQPEDEI